MQDTILQSIGQTPLVRLRRLAEGCRPASASRSSRSTPAAASRTASAWP